MRVFDEIMNIEPLYKECIYHAKKGGKKAVTQWMKETFCSSYSKRAVMRDVEDVWSMVEWAAK